MYDDEEAEEDDFDDALHKALEQRGKSVFDSCYSSGGGMGGGTCSITKLDGGYWSWTGELGWTGEYGTLEEALLHDITYVSDALTYMECTEITSVQLASHLWTPKKDDWISFKINDEPWILEAKNGKTRVYPDPDPDKDIHLVFRMTHKCALGCHVLHLYQRTMPRCFTNYILETTGEFPFLDHTRRDSRSGKSRPKPPPCGGRWRAVNRSTSSAGR